MSARTGYVQIYTGDGKGKTTAALGISLRALGRGLRVILIQFMKSDPSWGEIIMAKRIGIDVLQTGLDHWVHKGAATAEDLAAAAEGFRKAREIVMTGVYDLVVLDELMTATSFGLLPVEAILGLMRERPANVELVMTGRDAPEEIIAAADLVTEMVPRKHYYDAGVAAREGIEF